MRIENTSIDLTSSAECKPAVRLFHTDSSSEKLLGVNSVQRRSVLRGIMQTVQEQRFPPITDYFFCLFFVCGQRPGINDRNFEKLALCWNIFMLEVD